ncbi:MAG: thioredoxin domain-containing protein [Candidatus Eremiobacteraeota bacterium]|nr:thioredoxin domain-containing protein [Candidatus Eremiobacteraeota bacterium]
MSDFRFSPRPNRAGEIGWMPWGEDAFARAAAEDKPILLSISAVWCHWCHVMDETSYSDAGVIETINRSYVPVRVDNDRRPDINARYNMGGWPTTAFLAPDGTTLTGATYLPPQQMRNALAEIARFYAERKDEIASRAAEFRARPPRATASGDEPSDAPIASLIELLRATFDEEYAGFGDAPKFPQPEVHEFLVAQWRLRGEPDLHDMAARTMLAMTRGAMYDHVEGGFFRYSTTRDWSVPHFEKMAEDHAGLLRVLAALVTFAPTDELRATLVSTLRYVRSVLYDAKTGFFAGSQDADESYFALPLEARRERGAPYVDQTSYTNWTCALAGACCLSARALDDDALLTLAQRTLDNVHELLLDEDGLAHHVLQPGGAPEVRGLFADQVAYARALLDAHEVSGEARFLDRARTLCDVVIARFAAEGGAFYDRLGAQDALGRLALTDRPIVDNGTFADVLLRLAALMGSADYRERAAAILRFYSHASAAAGPFAATYARALQRYLAAEVTVRISGSAAATDAFREAALRLPSPFVSIRTLAPENETAIAYVCSGTTCGPPVREPAAIRSAYDALLP